jgi:hypothetical protein
MRDNKYTRPDLKYAICRICVYETENTDLEVIDDADITSTDRDNYEMVD